MTTTRAPDIPRTGHGDGWWRTGLAVAAVGWGANQFAPLLLLYRDRLGLSAVAVNAAFGLYALGLVPGLLLGGPLSDRIGRRRVVLPALAVSLLATLLLVAGGSWGTEWLFAGRFVAGVASGAAFSAGTAWIKELSARTDGGAVHGPRRATIAMTAGFAGGPLVAGVVAQWLPAPTVTAYVPHVLLTVAALVTATLAPETGRQGGARVGRFDGLRDPRFRRVVLPLAPWVFGSAAIALAYLPGLVSTRLGGGALLYGAIATAASALAGIAVQPVARRLADPDRPRRLLVLALALVVAGLLVAALAAWLASPVAVVVAVLVLGAGYGACQVCGLTEVTRMARPEHLAGMTAVYQAVSYVGFALPFVLAAVAPVASAWVLLLVVAALAALTLAAVAPVAGKPSAATPPAAPTPSAAPTAHRAS